MRRRLEHMADQIEAVLAQHRANGRITGGTVTPRWIRFQVIPAEGTPPSAMRNLSRELATALDVESVRVARQGSAVQVELPRSDPRPVTLLPLLRGLRDVPPATAVLGLADDGAPLLIRLPSPEVAHILVAGEKDAGKTNLLRVIALSLALRHPNGGLSLVLIDLKRDAFGDLAGLPQLSRPLIISSREAVEALHSLVRLATRRAERNGAIVPVVVVIDELAGLLEAGGQAIEQSLVWLLYSGHVAGVHVVASTEELSSPAVRRAIALFPVRLVGKTASVEEASVASGQRGSGAERLLDQGDFIAVAEGRVYRFQAARISSTEISEAVMAVRLRPSC